MRVVTTLVLIAGFGCAAEPSVTEVQQGVTASNKIAINKIAINKIAINKIAINKIAINKIAINKIAINAITTGDLLNSPDCLPDGSNEPQCGGRDLLEYLISCAFPEGTTLVGTAANGVTYNFDGSIGLAPAWERRRLTTREQRWMSACMLARVNKNAESVFISLRGPNEVLTVTAEERNEYDLEEGAYYGDIFSDPQQFYACRGEALYGGDLNFDLEGRSCAAPVGNSGKTQCQMTFTGDCAAFNVERACSIDSGEYYERCHTSESQNGRWHDNGHATRYEEAITVWIKPR
jgi:hypothetical protein